MLVATFGPTSGWLGKTVIFESEQFVLEGYGPIPAVGVMEYDAQGYLEWATPGSRAWVGAKAQASPSAAAPTTGRAKPLELATARIPPASSPAEPAAASAGTSGHPGDGWYYATHGERFGPLNTDQMVQLLAAGTLSNDTRVWMKDLAGWTPIDQTSLRRAPTAPPPLPGTAVNNGLVWTVAFVPLLGALLVYMIAASMGVSPGSLWYLSFGVLAANISLCAADNDVLRKAGHDTKTFGGWVFLIPVYLFKRAKALDQSLAYFVTWIVCFVVWMLA